MATGEEEPAVVDDHFDVLCSLVGEEWGRGT
jgi:hypothetical protein